MKMLLTTILLALSVASASANDQKDYDMAPPPPKNFNETRNKIRAKKIQEKKEASIKTKKTTR